MSSQLRIRKGYEDLVAEANEQIVTLTLEEAAQYLDDQDAAFIDIRDLPELERDGKIPGAAHASRGMLEFHVDPDSPYHKDVFSSGKEIVLYCASGGRSALAAQRLQEMGAESVSHIGGGLQAWNEAELPVEPVAED